ncbi:MAG: hemerythrin domain-containing protein [Nitrospirales bacterium]
MDFVTLLRQDQERVSSLFNQIQRGLGQPDTPERHRLFRQLKRELDLHAAVEDLHVYRVFQQAEPTRDAAHEAIEAHGKIKTLLDELEAAPSYDHKWIPKFQELHKLVQTHVASEENEIFRKTDEVMTPQEAEELGVAVETARLAIIRNAPPTEGGTPEQI